MTDAFDRLKAALADRYKIESELGAGGMATVYLAHDLKHDRKVAIKVLRPELAASIGVDRFLREIKIAANLNHPHILPLLDSEIAEEQPTAVPPTNRPRVRRSDRPPRFSRHPVCHRSALLLRIDSGLSIIDCELTASLYAASQNPG